MVRKIYIIIGSSAAGINACRTIRQTDKDCTVICITKDDFFPVNTCLLVDYLTKDININFVPDDFFEINNIIYYKKSEVVEINRSKKFIQLCDGLKLEYTYLILATGTRPRMPTIKIDNLFLFHNFSDAKRLKIYLNQNNIKRVTVLGTGLNGLELASALDQLNIKVELFNKNNFVLSRFIKTDIINKWLIDKLPINIIDNINNIKTDLTVSAIGTIPEDSLAIKAGLLTDNGIIVNRDFLTSDSSIYAVGDCAKLITENGTEQVSTWAGSIMQAINCCYNITGKKMIPQKPELIISQFFGFTLLYKKSYAEHNNNLSKDKQLFKRSHDLVYLPEEETEITDNYIKIIYKKNNLVSGFLFIGYTKKTYIEQEYLTKLLIN